MIELFNGRRFPAYNVKLLSTAVVAIVILLSLTMFLLPYASAESVSPWGSTTSYPSTIYAQSCATSSGYIYCMGGNTGSGTTSAVYYAPVISTGIGTWTETTDYGAASTSDNSGSAGVATEAQSCAISSGYVYCVGGNNGSGGTSTVYYAQVSSGGIGAWSQAKAYPISISDQSCPAYSGYIYCVGGLPSSGNTAAANYAALVPVTVT